MRRFVLACLLSATLAAHSSPTPLRADWSVPARYRGKLVTSRVRYFPEKLLALTFDDGPDPANTPRILKALKQYHAHATFFVLGGAAKAHPDLVKRIAAEGNCVGSHSYSHPQSTSPAQAGRELAQTAKLITLATGRRPTCFRPPYGIVKGNLAHLALSQRYAVFTWTVSSADTRKIGPDAVANNVIHTPSPGDIILMHDGPGHKVTADAVPRILKELTAAGFRFVTLPELLRRWDLWLARKHR